MSSKPPHVDEIRWEVTPDSLMAIAERPDIWPGLEVALKELQARHEAGLNMPTVEQSARKAIREAAAWHKAHPEALSWKRKHESRKRR